MKKTFIVIVIVIFVVAVAVAIASVFELSNKRMQLEMIHSYNKAKNASAVRNIAKDKRYARIYNTTLPLLLLLLLL